MPDIAHWYVTDGVFCSSLQSTRISFLALDSNSYSILLYCILCCTHVEQVWQCGHPLTYTIVLFQKIRHKLKLSVHMVNCMYIQRSPVKSQNPTHWNLIDHSTTSLPPVLLPYGICLPPSSHYAFISGRKNSAFISKMLLFYLFLTF